MKKQKKIQVSNLCKSFNKPVLQSISFDVAESEAMVIIGGSGSGKSVLIKNIMGLMSPDNGEIIIDGEDTTKFSRHQKSDLMHKFGVLFQGGALFDSLLVWQNISFGLLQAGKINKKDAYDLAVDKLKSVGLTPDIADLFPAELSGGMQKRVALARAIAGDPEIIFFDEPTTGLDPIMADVINDLIIKCSEEVGATTVTITHDMHSARKIADRIAMLYKGKFIWLGNKKDLDNSGNDYVDQFINGRAEGPITMQLQDHQH